MKTLSGDVASLALLGCAAGGGPRGTPIQPGQPFSSDYVNVKAPDSTGWLLMQASDAGITFGRKGPSETESCIASVSLFVLPPTNTRAEFEDLIRAGVQQDTPPERYNMQRQTLGYTDERGYPCVRYQALASDKHPRGPDTPLLLALDGLYCRHPKQQDTGFAAIYSFRGKTEHPEIRAEAESFIQGTQVAGP